MKEKILHRLGAFILVAVVLFGVGALGDSTVQARHHHRVVIVPRVYIGPGPYYRDWRHHWHYRGW